jgi:hypothetical protein
MDKFQDAYNQPKLNHVDINHLNRSITSNEIEAVIKSLPTNKTPGPDGFMTEFYQIFKEEQMLFFGSFTTFSFSIFQSYHKKHYRA